jgi:hypothetical protein
MIVAMNRRAWLTTFAALPFSRAVKALDLVKVTVRYDGKVRTWWEPRGVAERRFANVLALLRYPPRTDRARLP